MINVALLGNPNVGKTTLYNALTGSNQYVGNWPGVTVDKKEGYFENVKIADLPGIYAMDTFSNEEKVSKKYLEEDPTFDDTRESRFSQKAIEYSGEPANPEAFQQEVSNYKSYRDLDKWKLSMFSLILEKIKKSEESLA